MNSEKVKNFSNQPYSIDIALIRGELAVEKVLLVLESYKRQKIIRNFGTTDAFSRDDSKGIDIFIYLNGEGKVLLQVKSSYHERERKRYNKRGRYYIAVPPRMGRYEVETLVAKILTIEIAKKLRKKANKKRYSSNQGAFLFYKLC